MGNGDYNFINCSRFICKVLVKNKIMSSVKIIQQTTHQNKELFVYELKLSNGSAAVITNYGGILMSLLMPDKDGLIRDVVLGFDKVEQYWSEEYLENYPYFGAVIGRYANRIKGGSFVLENKEVILSKNIGENILHGGFEGFDKKVWEVIEVKEGNECSLMLQYTSEDGEEGFPGKLITRIRFELFEKELKYSIEAFCDKATAINLTYHPYFNLDINKAKIDKQQAKIYSDYWLEQDEDFCTTGQLISVKDTAYDFTNWQKIAQPWNENDGYDQSFVIYNHMKEINLVAEAMSSDHKMHLQVFSDAPIVHFYTGKYIPELMGKEQQNYKPFCGYCFETHQYPNAVNISHFPLTILKPNEIYKQSTFYKF